MILKKNSFLSMLLDGGVISKCTAKYGGINHLENELQAYANANIEKSFEFLLMSTHFGNYEANREGFKELYRKLSDKLWEEAIDLMKYITQRGGKMDLNQLPRFKRPVSIVQLFQLIFLIWKHGGFIHCCCCVDHG